MVHKKELVGFLIGLFVFGYASSYGETGKIESTIRSYLDMLVRSSISEEKISLEEFQKRFSSIADEEISRKLYFWIQAWHDGGLYMDARLKEIIFEKVDFEGNTATAITQEKWNYRYIDKGHNRVVLPDTKILYRIEYKLKNTGGKWIITKINILNEKKINSQEGKK